MRLVFSRRRVQPPGLAKFSPSTLWMHSVMHVHATESLMKGRAVPKHELLCFHVRSRDHQFGYKPRPWY